MRSQYYCNINGKYGMGAYGRPEYPKLSDLLSHLDRMGIWQTVAYHSNACDLHPVYGYRFLFEDIEKTPGVRYGYSCSRCCVGNGKTLIY